MDNNSENVVSRRSFFRKAAERSLPILGMIVMSHIPIDAHPLNMDVTGCNTGCKGGCKTLCEEGCSHNCSGSCKTGCKEHCKNTCKGTSTTYSK